jgi:octaprenyl-diphosphate synthase
MPSPALRRLPGGDALREVPAGMAAGAKLSAVQGPAAALRLVAEDLSEAEAELRQLVHSDVAAVPAVAGYLVDAGGKRLRPALTALGARAIGFQGRVARLMCVGELIHLGSLLHDDVVDDGMMRRGRPASHRVHGSAVTVLTGDFCLARAVQLAAEEGGYQAVKSLSVAVTEMAEGEVLQLQRAGDLTCDYETYLDVISRKSGALIAWCAGAAAWTAGEPERARALSHFGRSVGRAFQITDDVLDYAEHTGKNAGIDLRERKVTLPLLLAMERLDGLREELQARAPSQDDLPELMARIRASGALEASLDHARAFVDEGIGQLDLLPDGEGRRALESLGRYLVERVT